MQPAAESSTRSTAVLRWRRRAAAAKDISQRLARHRKGDAYSSYVLAERAAHLFAPEYPFSEYGLSWVQDAEFLEYYRRYVLEPGRPENWHSADRKYFLRSLLQLTTGVPGDMAECGVYRGATARLMGLAAGEDRTLHLFDSFEGLSTPSDADGGHWQAHDMRAAQDAVGAALEDVSVPYVLHAGWIPERFPDVAERRFCFVHVDVDLYQPTLDALEFFYPRLAPRGILLLDDHGFTTCPGARRATEEWSATVPDPVIEVPTGQAFVIRSAAVEGS